MLFNREPALLLALVAALVQTVSAFLFELSVDQQGTVNAVAIALVALATAWRVRGDSFVPAILGAFQAVLALSLAFGLDLSPERQSIVMLLVGTVVAVVVRDRVVAPVGLQAV